MDEPSPGNLRLSTEKISTFLSLLMPAFSLATNPHALPIVLPLCCIAPLPIVSLDTIPKLRCKVLAPVIFGAVSLDQ